MNRFLYVTNDPINFVDPTGEDGEDDCPPFSNCDGNYAQLQDSVDCSGTFAGCDSSGPPTDDFDDLPDAPTPNNLPCDWCSSGQTPDASLTFTFSATPNTGVDTLISGPSQNLGMPLNSGFGAMAVDSSFQPAMNGGFAPGSRLPNGDVAVGMDIFHNSRQCPNCGTIMNSAGAWGDIISVGLVAISGVATAGIASAEAPALLDALIGRQVPGSLRINSGLLNSNPLLRIGLGWQAGVGTVFRIALLSGPSTIHLLDQPWPFPLYTWPPSILP